MTKPTAAFKKKEPGSVGHSALGHVSMKFNQAHLAQKQKWAKSQPQAKHAGSHV